MSKRAQALGWWLVLAAGVVGWLSVAVWLAGVV